MRSLDPQRSRQYSRLDQYYQNDQLTSNEYLKFVEEQHQSFNNLRLLSPVDLHHWLNRIPSSYRCHQDLSLTEICLFLIKEILLNLMDKLHSSSLPSHPSDILRREYTNKHRRLSYTKRKARKSFFI